MSVRPHKDPGVWIIDCYPDGKKGKRERIPYAGTEAEALALERQLMRSAKNPGLMTAPTLADMVTEWSAYIEAELSRNTVLDIHHCLKKLLPAFGPLRPALLAQIHVDRYKQSRLADGVKKRTINKELSYLSMLVKFGVARGYCNELAFRIASFPAKQCRAPEPHPLSPEDISLMYGTIEPCYRLVFLLMADAGLRMREALNLRRENLDLRHGVIYVKGKGEKERIVPILTDRLRGEITAALQTAADYLSVNPETGKPYYNIRKPLTRAAKEAGVKRIYHHLLRHSFATIATVSGMQVNSIQQMLGHADLKTTTRYQHLAADFLKAEGKKFIVDSGGQNKLQETTLKQGEAKSHI